MDAAPSLNLILGPILLGSCFGWGLFGIFVLQTYLYYRWYPNDHIGLKLLVAGLFVLELADTAVSTHAVWYFTITGWGDPSFLFASPWSFCAAVILTGLIAAVAQFFFARRLWILSHSILIMIVVITLALAQLACSIVGSAQVLSTKIQNSSKLSTFDAFSIWLACSAACDIAIAAGMVYFLSRNNQATIRATEYLITRLTNFAIRTGTFTAVCAVLSLAFFLSLKTTDLNDVPFLMLGKLYSNTVLANLNARAALQAGSNDLHIEGAGFTSNVDFALRPTDVSNTVMMGSLGPDKKDQASLPSSPENMYSQTTDESKLQLA